MEKDFCEQAHEAVVKVLGEAVVQVLAEQCPLTNESVADMVELRSEGEPDLAVEFALDMLRE